MKTRSSCGLPCEMLEPIVGAAVLWRRGRAAWPPAAGLDHQAISLLLFEHIRAFFFLSFFPPFFEITLILWLGNDFSILSLLKLYINAKRELSDTCSTFPFSITCRWLQNSTLH